MRISHLSLNYSSLASADAFKRLLSMYDWTEQLQNKKRIEGIKDIKVIPQDRVLKGALMRGMEVVMDLSELFQLQLCRDGPLRVQFSTEEMILL